MGQKLNSEITHHDEKMKAIYEARLPGFYIDARGAYGIVIGRLYICCSINLEDGAYDVTVDTVDKNGDFALNIDWESYTDPKEAIHRLRYKVQYFAKRPSTW